MRDAYDAAQKSIENAPPLVGAPWDVYSRPYEEAPWKSARNPRLTPLSILLKARGM